MRHVTHAAALTLVLVALACTTFATGTGAAATANNEAVTFIPPPRPDSRTIQKMPDTQLYREIFLLQENTEWKRADRLIAQIENPLLMGHVLFQRYMHPTAYRARWPELRDWLKKYADQPDAWRVYKLAQKRSPRGVAMPKRPPSQVQLNAKARQASPLFRTRTKRQIKNRVFWLVRRERPTQALNYITRRPQKNRLTATETDFLKSLIARSYYIEGKINKSLQLALQATRNRRHVQLADWHVGLAAYRLGHTDLAILHFEYLAENSTASVTLRARASYWAARVLRQSGELVRAEEHLRAAASSGAHFYSLLAAQHISSDLQIDWRRADNGSTAALVTHPAVQRASMLRAVGHDEHAEWELLHLHKHLAEPEARALLAYARENYYPAVQLALSSRLGARLGNGQPLPLYESSFPLIPQSKAIHIDRALLFALIRQESRFQARAKSSAGARGIMQIMPRTAAFISGDRKFAHRYGRDRLFDAQINMSLGQKYLKMLMSEDYFEKNLILVLAAYNAGPGNVRRWRRELADVSDPLLFIESVPARETRNYIHLILRNLWIYRHRLAQEPISQRLLAAQTWPLYHQQDTLPHIVPASIENQH